MKIANLLIFNCLLYKSTRLKTRTRAGFSIAGAGLSKPNLSQVDSIKWYKDGGEFYRVHPGLEGREEVRQFSVSGVVVDTNNTGLTQTGSNTWQHSVNIINTKLATSGTFRCQITEARAPFHTEQQDKNITVISKYID